VSLVSSSRPAACCGAVLLAWPVIDITNLLSLHNQQKFDVRACPRCGKALQDVYIEVQQFQTDR
jgi:hypothetical protein